MSIKRRRNGKGKSNFIKIIAYSIGIVLCTGALLYAVIQSVGKAVPDKIGCYKEATTNQHVHALIDNSNPRFSITQNRSIIRYFESLYDELEFNGKISIYTTGDHEIASISKASFSICKPATTGKELEKINAANASDGYLEKQKKRLYQQHFLPNLKAILAKDLEESKKASSSPLLEITADLSRLPSMKSGSKLVLISDLFQSSSSVKPFCFVKGALPIYSSFSQWPVYKSLNSQASGAVKTNANRRGKRYRVVLLTVFAP